MNSTRLITATAFAALTIVGCNRAQNAAPQLAAPHAVLPRPEPPFQGKIGRTARESTPDFPKEFEAPKGLFVYLRTLPRRRT